MGLWKRFVKWYRHNKSYKWIDKGDPFVDYELIKEYDHAAKVELVTRQPQIHPDTGEKRIKRKFGVGAREPLSKFDSKGYLFPESNNPIAPHSESDAVKNPDKDSDVQEFHVTLGEE